LLVEDNPDDVRLLQHQLADAPGQSFHVAQVELLAEALVCLGRDAFDAILLDLSLPDSQSLDTLARVMAAAPHLPIVVMTGLDDEAKAVEAVRQGAQDFLLKGHGDGRLLVRSIRYAMERKQAERELKTLNETLEQRVAERTAVATHRAAQLQVLALELTRTEHRERRRLANILHDHLQQLLYAARLSLGSLRRCTHAEPLCAEVLARADDLLNQSIDVSRSLTVELSPPILYEAGLAAALEWLGRHMQETCGLTVQVDADSQANPESEDLGILLFEAARELLFNVMKHAHTGAAQVRMRATPRGDVQLVVSDEGSGLNSAKLKTERATNAGFGLFSIRERLELLGGSLTLEGAPDQGTRVTVSVSRRLPDLSAAEVPEAQGLPADSAEPAAADQPPPGRRIRVLLADDEQSVRDGLSHLLREQADIELVGVAGNGRTALELAFQKRPDVVVLDVTMPDLGGVEVTRRLTAVLPGIRVIGLSVHEEEDAALTMRAAGASAYLTKNGSPEALLAAIRGRARPPHEDHYYDYREQDEEPEQEVPRHAGR
jgi:DNA-binding NarL/FixJ family response regulator